MDVGDNFMIIISNQEVQVGFGKSWILYPDFHSPMREKQHKYKWTFTLFKSNLVPVHKL